MPTCLRYVCLERDWGRIKCGQQFLLRECALCMLEHKTPPSIQFICISSTIHIANINMNCVANVYICGFQKGTSYLLNLKTALVSICYNSSFIVVLCKCWTEIAIKSEDPAAVVLHRMFTLFYWCIQWSIPTSESMSISSWFCSWWFCSGRNSFI